MLGYFLYWGLAYTFCVVSLAGLVLQRVRTKSEASLWLTLFAASVTVTIVAMSLRELIPTESLVRALSGPGSLVGAALSAAFLPRFAATLEGVRRRIRFARVLFMVCLALAFLDAAQPFIPFPWFRTLLTACTLVALAAAVYCSLLWIFRLVPPRRDSSPLLAVAFLLFFTATAILDFFGLAGALVPSLQGHRILFPAFVSFMFLVIIRGNLGSLASVSPTRASPTPESGRALERFGVSQREAEVAFLMARGRTYREIADELCVSLSTIKSHASHLYDKTGARNKVELRNLVETPGR